MKHFKGVDFLEGLLSLFMGIPNLNRRYEAYIIA